MQGLGQAPEDRSEKVGCRRENLARLESKFVKRIILVFGKFFLDRRSYFLYIH